jgi:Tfp pilus assembly protein PilF
VVHQFIGDLVNAMRDYQRAASIQPDYSLAHFNIGNVLFQQRHFKQVRYVIVIAGFYPAHSSQCIVIYLYSIPI